MLEIVDRLLPNFVRAPKDVDCLNFFSAQYIVLSDNFDSYTILIASMVQSGILRVKNGSLGVCCHPRPSLNFYLSKRLVSL